MHFFAVLLTFSVTSAAPAAEPRLHLVADPRVESTPCGVEQLQVMLERHSLHALVDQAPQQLPAGDLIVVLNAGAAKSARITIESSDGVALFQRELPEALAACEQLTDYAALIIDRFLADIRWSGRHEAPVSLHVDPGPSTAPAPTPPPRDARLRTALSLTTLLQPAPAVASLAGGLEVAAAGRLRSFELAVRAAIFAPASALLDPATPATGSLGVVLFSPSLAVSRPLRLGPGELAFEAAGGLELAWFRAVGPTLLRAQTQLVPLPWLGLGAAYEVTFLKNFAVVVRAQGRGTWAHATLTVEGIETAQFQTKTWSWQAAVGLSCAL